jgi:hypothetical protein
MLSARSNRAFANMSVDRQQQYSADVVSTYGYVAVDFEEEQRRSGQFRVRTSKCFVIHACSQISCNIAHSNETVATHMSFADVILCT